MRELAFNRFSNGGTVWPVLVSTAQESSTEMRTDSSGVLEEIIITATKVETSIQDTPIAVSAFSQDQLDSQLINDTMNLQFNVPNMTMSKQNFTANDIRIRGIGAGAGIHINGGPAGHRSGHPYQRHVPDFQPYFRGAVL